MVSSRAQSGPLRVLFVGNVIRRKGLHILIAALAQLSPDLWVLDIVGDETIEPAYTAEIIEAIEHLPDGVQVNRLGRLEQEELASRFLAAHVLSVPSSYEGFGIVYVEGFGYGLPALATTSGAAGEVIEDAVTGFLIPPEDANQLARCLFQLATDRELLSDMGTRALQRYAEFPTWESSTSRIRQFLLEQVAHKASQK